MKARMSKRGNIVRVSRFRHIYGEGAKREQCFEGGPQITRSAHDGGICAVNPKSAPSTSIIH